MRSRNDLLSRLTALLLAFSLLFSLAACGPAAADTTAEAETAGKGTTLSAAESAEVPVSLSVKESLAIKESLAVMESPGPVESISIRESSAARPGTAQAASLIEGITPEEVSGKEADETFTASQYRFAAELFRRSYEEDKGNCLISPLSVILALAMTANGAEGDTLAQMLRVLGDGMSLDDLNAYLYAYVHSLPSTEKAKLAIANSLWLNDRKDFSVREAFLRADASWYDAAVYKLPFDDSAVGEVNGWVAQKTDRMITEIIDKLEEDARMLLINAICFDAKWAHPYADYSVQSGTFTKTDGTQQTVSMMWSEEFNYYEGADYTGFAKYYDGNTYKFVAILPDKNVPIDTFAASLTADKLADIMNSLTRTRVICGLPKFSYDYSASLSQRLQDMGMVNAFVDDMTRPDHADFSGMSDTPLYISDVIHKTFIEVTEAGTRAAAVTVVQTEQATAIVEMKRVTLDRPFLYMIVDCETELPIFIGTVNEINP